MNPAWLKAVPWSTIMSNAPLIVGGAKRIASLVKNRSVDTAQADVPAGARADLARLEDLERRQDEQANLLRSVMQTNAELTQAVGALRARVTLSLWISVIALACAVTVAVWVALR